MSWRVVVSDLLPRMGSTRTVAVSEGLEQLSNGVAAVGDDAPVSVELHLERIPDGLVARGMVRATYRAECGRCLQGVGGDIAVHVDELFEPDPVPGETYLLDHDAVDLAPLVRDAVVLELPRTALCRPDCAGLCPRCGTDRNTEACDCPLTDPDPRWDALRSLSL
jgi:uncharacterized protein